MYYLKTKQRKSSIAKQNKEYPGNIVEQYYFASKK
jgi:hypothetical protein